ncbi:hypothetical protein BKA70DRAFT_1575987 [Coprinopsis sp. MPI-PUGE-AT-0042]|nr:hypothetical protein BKA70DRAFT_1575987 [Coprinopsis sp. MPI-PUGE-AT-0042]
MTSSWTTKSWLNNWATKLSDTKVCAHSPAIKSPSVGAVIVNSDGRPQRRSLSSSSSDSSSIDEPLTPSDHEAFSIGILSAAPCSLPLTLHEKRKGSTLEQIFIPTCPPVPGISIEESPEFAFENLLPASQTFGWWLLPEPQDTEAARPEFVVLEAFPTSQFRQLSLAHDLRLVNEPITIRATIPFSNSLTEQHRNFLRFSSFLGSKAVRAMASRVLAIDILLPHGYTGAWATDLDRLTETFDTSNPNLTFPNLVSFKWQGARMAKHGLPAPYYDFNALPLAQLREVIVKAPRFQLSTPIISWMCALRWKR